MSVQVYGINVPVDVLDFKITDIIENEKDNNGLGVTIYYNAPGVKASLYIYDYGFKNLDDGAISPAARSHFLEAWEGAMNVYSPAKIVQDPETLVISDRSVLHAAFCAIDDYSQAKSPIYSHIYLTCLNEMFIKLRVSYSAENQPKRGHDKHLEFTTVLFNNIQPVNNGTIKSD